MMNIYVCIQTPPMYTIKSITSKLLCAILQSINATACIQTPPNIHLKTQRRFIQTFKYALLKVMSTNATPCILNTSSMHCNNDVTVCLLTPLLCTVNMRCVYIQTSMHCKRCVSKLSVILCTVGTVGCVWGTEQAESRQSVKTIQQENSVPKLRYKSNQYRLL